MQIQVQVQDTSVYQLRHFEDTHENYFGLMPRRVIPRIPPPTRHYKDERLPAPAVSTPSHNDACQFDGNSAAWLPWSGSSAIKPSASRRGFSSPMALKDVLPVELREAMVYVVTGLTLSADRGLGDVDIAEALSVDTSPPLPPRCSPTRTDDQPALVLGTVISALAALLPPSSLINLLGKPEIGSAVPVVVAPQEYGAICSNSDILVVVSFLLAAVVMVSGSISKSPAVSISTRNASDSMICRLCLVSLSMSSSMRKQGLKSPTQHDLNNEPRAMSSAEDCRKRQNMEPVIQSAME